MVLKILDKYLIREVFRYMMICHAVLFFIYLVVDFFQKIDDFIEAKVSKFTIIKFFFYKSPFIISQLIPVSLLLSVIITAGLMKRNNELISLRSSGISLYRIFMPFFFFSLLTSLFSFLFSETVVPYSSSMCQEVWNKEVRKGKYRRFFRRRNIWYKGKNYIYWIECLEGRRMKRAIFYFFERGFFLKKRIQAKEVLWNGSEWIAEDVLIQERCGKRYVTKRLRRLKLSISETPESFLRPVRKPEEMNFWELKRFAKQIEEEGYDARRYLVDAYVKTAFPFINIIVVLIGIPATLKLKSDNIPLAVSLGILICFTYLLVMSIFRSLGISGILPPFLSAWSANLFFLLLGIYMIMHID